MTDTNESPESTETRTAAPAAAGSPLAGLRARRQAAAAALFTDLVVPRYDPPVYVRFSPLPQDRLQSGAKQIEKSKNREIVTIVNAGFLAESCVGVFEIVDGAEVSIDPDDRDGDWPKFDQRLAGLLGIDAIKAVEVVRGLYLTDGDVIATAGKVAEFSGYTGEDLDREFEGN